MNFQLKLYQLIKPRLRDQKYEISSWSSLLSFESDWLVPCLWTDAISFPWGRQPFTMLMLLQNGAWQIGQPPIIYLRNRKLRGVERLWGSLAGKEQKSRDNTGWSGLSPAQHGKHTQEMLALPCLFHSEPEWELLTRSLHLPSSTWNVLVGSPNFVWEERKPGVASWPLLWLGPIVWCLYFCRIAMLRLPVAPGSSSAFCWCCIAPLKAERA